MKRYARKPRERFDQIEPTGDCVYIYVLHEPHGNDPRYIGATCFPDAVVDRHMNQPNRGTPRCLWIEDLKRRGERPALEVVDSIHANSHSLETAWISAYRRLLGDRILNIEGTWTIIDGHRLQSLVDKNGNALPEVGNWRDCPESVKAAYERYIRLKCPTKNPSALPLGHPVEVI